jgi:Uma2 family endonuclease
MSAVTHPTLSADEFAAVMRDHGWSAPVELIAGEVVFVTPTGGSAAYAQVEIAHALRSWDAGGCVLTDVFVRIGESYLGPDVAWWRAERRPAIAAGAIDTVPDVVVEILSPATRANDLGPKRQQYLAGGVGELWLVDPETRSVVLAGPDGERRLGARDTLTSERIPGFSLRVAALFA